MTRRIYPIGFRYFPKTEGYSLKEKKKVLVFQEKFGEKIHAPLNLSVTLEEEEFIAKATSSFGEERVCCLTFASISFIMK